VSSLKILSGGAAQGLVASLTPQFTSRTGWGIDGSYGAVGGMAERFRKGAAVDVMISTAALIAEFEREGLLRAGSTRPIGKVDTAIAVRTGDKLPPIGNEAALRASLMASDAIYVPDVVSSTAGIHVAKVLRQLSIFGEVESRLKIFPNGATAMHELAASNASRPIGCTQTTEIVITPGLTLVGPLPPACALATVYSAAVTARAADGLVAKTLINILADDDQLAARQRAGFLES
jgi:molybdate transport system substrate-binding protein